MKFSVSSLSQPEAHNHCDVRDNGLRSTHRGQVSAQTGLNRSLRCHNAAVVSVTRFAVTTLLSFTSSSNFPLIAVSFEIEVVAVRFASPLIRWFLPLVTHNRVRDGIYADLMCFTPNFFLFHLQ